MTSNRAPIATYRVQLRPTFQLIDAAAVVPQLRRLGVSDLYCSPLLTARSGSEHGYDVVNPQRVNSELGGERGLRELSQSLHEHEMGLLVDIVPNHMAVSHENHAWMDVLEFAAESPYARWFDLTWPHAAPLGHDIPIYVPVLGADLDQVIADHEITLSLDHDALVLAYHDWRFPLRAAEWPGLLKDVVHDLQDRGDAIAAAALQAILEQFGSIAGRGGAPNSGSMPRTRIVQMKQAFAELIHKQPTVERAIQRAIHLRNKHHADNPSIVREMLDRQPYCLRCWRDARKRNCYRRFFDVAELIGVRVEDTEVFQQTHQAILELIGEGIISALRIDHIDGLADPRGYLDMLQRSIRDVRTPPSATANATGSQHSPFPVLVEKILEGGELLEPTWPVDGTTGYDFLNALAMVFVNPTGLRALIGLQIELAGTPDCFSDRIPTIKRYVAERMFAGEVRALTELLTDVAERFDSELHADGPALSSALVELSAHMPVYRTYLRDGEPLPEHARRLIHEALDMARTELVGQSTRALEFIQRILLRDIPESARPLSRTFTRAWQQFTGPLMAKGLEDTALYRDARLLSINEVGVSPEQFDNPRGMAGFHEHNERIARDWPLTMTATATHDTKRSEDMRARLHVLSDIPDDWGRAVRRWMRMNEHLRRRYGQLLVPEPATELFIYQTLFGVWPLREADEAELPDRLDMYFTKAWREAKERTSWLQIDEEYESAVAAFVRDLLDPAVSATFLDDFHAFRRPLEWFGALNGLAQVVLKIASPGIPDVYQGTELWDFSLVDPDNRRPVDFGVRRELLENLPNPDVDAPPLDRIAEMLDSWRDGRIKLYVLHRCLTPRRMNPTLFAGGAYIPLAASGDREHHICTFVRSHDSDWAVATAAIHTATIPLPEGAAAAPGVWRSTHIKLPADAPQRWRDVLTGLTHHTTSGPDGHALDPAQIFQRLPIALLMSDAERD